VVLYDVVTAVVNLTGGPQSETWSMAPPDCGGLGMSITCRVKTLSTTGARQTFDEIAAGGTARCILAWVPLMQGGEAPGAVEEWKRLALEEKDSRVRSDMAGLARVFARLAGRFEVWATGLEGWDVEVSPFLEEIRQQTRARTRVETRAETLRNNLLRVLRFRFGASLPIDLPAAVAVQTDPEALDRWFDQALQLNTPAEIRAAWGLPPIP
jgi:hypothetical protein